NISTRHSTCTIHPPHYLFFFQSYGHPRHLHSFPTRRSSDLPAQAHQNQNTRGTHSFARCCANAHRRNSKAGKRKHSVSAIETGTDRKSTRLNSSHSQISYAVFCLKKKKKKQK